MTRTQAKILLLGVFTARGTSFVFLKSLLGSMGPLNIMGVRFTLAFLILALLFSKRLRACTRTCLRDGVILGVLYTVCILFELYGLRLIDSGVCALIENMAIVLVPIYVAVFTRTLPGKKTMLCAALAVIGVGFLSLTQRGIGGGGLGVVLSVLAAMTFAACVIATEKFSAVSDPITIGIIEIGAIGVLSLILSLASGDFALPRTGGDWAGMLMLVLVCSCFGFTFQPLGQRYLPSETAAVFTVMNPLTASVLGVVVAGESVSAVKLIGYALILGALLLYNLRGPRERAR